MRAGSWSATQSVGARATGSTRAPIAPFAASKSPPVSWAAMPRLYEALSARVDQWRREGGPCAESAAISEILDWASDPDSGAPRHLRLPQLRALETYWYLRLVERTPHVFELYERLFPSPLER